MFLIIHTLEMQLTLETIHPSKCHETTTMINKVYSLIHKKMKNSIMSLYLQITQDS